LKNELQQNLKVFILAGVLLASVCSTASFAKEPNDQNNEIADYILTHLGYTEKMNILCYLYGPVSTAQKISTAKETVFITPDSGYVMYIDLYPAANLFHPVQYVFLNDQTKELLVFDETCSPLNFNEYQIIDTDFSRFFFSIQNRRATIPGPIVGETGQSGRDSRWAVLMNGGADSGNNHVRYWNDLSNIYITLTTVYEFPDENIIVLCSDGLDPAVDQSNGQNSNPDLDGDGDADIMYSCVLSNVEMVFQSLAENFTGSEKLFIFTTDHGGSNGGYDTYENLWNWETLTDAHFAELLAAIPAAEKICTFEPCFSGGFLDNLGGEPGPIVATSACNYNEYSWAMPPDYVYDTYVFHWTAAVKGEDAYGVPVDADANQDGLITMDEAYAYAVAHDQDDESPQYYEYPEGTGSYLSLKVTSDPPAKPSKPAGSTLGIWYVEYTYTSTTTEPDNEEIYYQFNWDDGSTSGWVGPYSSGQTGVASHVWTVLGTYNVTVKAKDVWGATSERSDPLAVTITDNTPPEIPQITGPAQGKPGKPYLFNIVSTDAQDQNIYYFIDWGDNTTSDWLGPYLSGIEIHVTHTWTEQGSYTVKIKAKDIMDSESDWGTLPIVMPAEYRFSFMHLLQHLFERYPYLFPLVQHILG
jgi:hypothetical protein